MQINYLILLYILEIQLADNSRENNIYIYIYIYVFHAVYLEFILYKI